MRILVQPERLRQTAQELRRAQESWQGQAARLRQVFSNLDWETRQRLEVEGQVQQAVALAESLAARAGEKAAFLEAAAARFEQADSQGAQGLGAVLGASAVSALAGLNLPLGLGDWSGGRIPLTRVVAPSGGGEAAGLGLFASLTWLGSAALWFGQAIWNWLYGYPVQIASPLPSDPPKGRLYETVLRGLERANQRQTTSPGQSIQTLRIEDKPASSSAQPVQTLHIEDKPASDSAQVASSSAQLTPSFGHDVPRQSQQGLKYGDKPTQYGCTATSVSMVLDYWHKQDSKNKTMTAQEILNKNIEQGTFSGTGLSVSQTHDEIQSLGYKTVEDHINATFDQLKADLEKGPVVAVVKLGMKTSGYNHAVVVNGISADGKQVSVIDPWDGQPHIYSVEDFTASWGTLNNSYMVIRP